jgi:alginate O-acetyltransferase complex protein AlgI
MLFLERWFWLFAALAIPVTWVCPRPLKVPWLLAASLMFQYHFAGPAGMTPIVGLAVLTYVVGLRTPARRGRLLFFVACATLVGALAFYKYSAFLLHLGAQVVAAAALPVPAWTATWRSPAIPLGISFFTFEFVHYLYEVHVTGRSPIRNPLHFSLFAVFFPTLAAGPIKRFPDFVPQLSELSTPDLPTVWSAGRRVIRGLFKKVCVADMLVEYIFVFEHVRVSTAPVVILLAVAQGFRIYYDFAGYSDIAIGLAQMLNLRVPENFTRPYLATSLQEFWRRWHISLSTWIRDYVYIPLGGNRVHRGLNLLVAMALCGLWHGAAVHFAAWGIYHGTGLALEAAVRRWRPGWFADRPVQRVLGWAACYAFVTYGWLVFFYPLHTVLDLTKGLLRWDFGG